jgi:hypothetical protein
MENLGQFADSLPSHCVKTVADLARSSADMWTQLARQLERRAQDIEQR